MQKESAHIRTSAQFAPWVRGAIAALAFAVAFSFIPLAPAQADTFSHADRTLAIATEQDLPAGSSMAELSDATQNASDALALQASDSLKAYLENGVTNTQLIPAGGSCTYYFTLTKNTLVTFYFYSSLPDSVLVDLRDANSKSYDTLRVPESYWARWALSAGTYALVAKNSSKSTVCTLSVKQDNMEELDLTSHTIYPPARSKAEAPLIKSGQRIAGALFYGYAETVAGKLLDVQHYKFVLNATSRPMATLTAQGTCYLQVYDSAGKQVAKATTVDIGNGVYRTELNMGTLAPGTYDLVVGANSKSGWRSLYLLYFEENPPSNLKVSLPKTSYTIAKGGVKPQVKVTLDGKTLAASKYKVTYSNNTSVGRAKVTVTPTGSADSVSAEFIINPKGTSITSIKGKKKSAVITWKKQASQTSGYQVRYSTKKTMKGAKFAHLSKPGASKGTITGLKSGKTYYFQICTYKTIGSESFCSTWSKTVKVRVK